MRYIRHSNLQIVFDLNPFQWRLYVMHAGPSQMDPGRHLFSVKVLFLRVNLILDDGSTM